MFEKFILENNLPSYRLKQINLQYYGNNIASWDELSTWPITLRNELSKQVPFSKLLGFQKYKSDDKRTIKTISYTSEGYPVETVLMKSKSRNTICVSCMSGCPVGCKFCATGQMQFNRNLDVQEIIDQIMYFKRQLSTTGQTITNVVFMGMGEPMLNLENVTEAIKILTHPDKVALGRRRITVSTVGYIEQLKKFLKSNLGVKIAVSLHAPTQALRENIMPTVSKENHLDDLIDTLIDYQKKSNKKITYEYLLLKNINDQPEHAIQLSKLLKNQIALVNLIGFNDSPGIPFQPSIKKSILAFQNILDSRGINNTLRHSYGNDIKAACGQLASVKPS
jgi:23S rRNA (adenine2503-C2)-methyltransferase